MVNEISRKEDEKKCVDAARNVLKRKKVVKFKKVVVNEDKTLSEKEEEEELLVIQTPEDLNKYCSKYLEKFKKYHLKQELEKPEIIIERCLIKCSAQDQSSFYTLNHCQVEFGDQRNIAFYNIIKINSCHFLSEAFFTAPNYQGQSVVDKSIFDSQINFSGFKTIKIKKSLINKLIANGNSSSPEIKNSQILNAEFGDDYRNDLKLTDNTIIEKSVFSNTTFKSAAIFTDVTFKTSPKIYGQLKFESCNVEFKNIKFEDLNSSEALGIFRSIKKSCEDAHYEHGVILFHGFELETNYNVHLKDNWKSRDFPEAIASWLHKKRFG